MTEDLPILVDENRQLTDWLNEPTIEDLKVDYENSAALARGRDCSREGPGLLSRGAGTARAMERSKLRTRFSGEIKSTPSIIFVRIFGRLRFSLCLREVSMEGYILRVHLLTVS